MKIHQQNYETLSEAMNSLKEQGFTYEFDFKNAHLIKQQNNGEFKAHQLKIVEIHRFEGMTNPDDSAILYAIQCEDGSKGLLVDAYGVYADPEKTAFIDQIEILSE
ncbi:MAG: phosphoribosylpyrophosphate synthetase [Sphingobacteriales bacterium]|nr:phosphoribosylpyrophosphate synthetase [Sphingobacteriales bacterium]